MFRLQIWRALQVRWFCGWSPAPWLYLSVPRRGGVCRDEGDWRWQAAECLFTSSWFLNVPAKNKWERGAITVWTTFSSLALMELSNASRLAPFHINPPTPLPHSLYNLKIYMFFDMWRHRGGVLSGGTSWPLCLRIFFPRCVHLLHRLRFFITWCFVGIQYHHQNFPERRGERSL